MQRILVVGGGAAGSAVVGELLRGPDAHELEIIWLLGRRAPGRGIAYAAGADHHLLNVRAAGMDLFTEEAGAFLDYVISRRRGTRGGDFVPRAWFGDFMESSLARRIDEARDRGQWIVPRLTEALAVRRDPRGWTVTTEDGDKVACDGVVLAVGALPPQAPPGVSAAAQRSDAYMVDPWRWPPSKRACQRVVILGSGLTAVDAMLTAARRWPQARLTAVSRRGLLPRTHASGANPTYPRLAGLVARLHARPSLHRWLHAVRAEIAHGTADWRAVIDGLRPEIPGLWQRLDAAQRSRFLRHLRRHWELLSHRMPPQTAAEVARLHDEGRFTLIAGQMLAVDVADPALVRVRLRGGDVVRTLRADLVIQANGLDSDATTTSHRLIRQLVDEGLVAADPLGLGLRADTRGRLLRDDGVAVGGLRCLGTLLRGAQWESTGLAEIRAMASAIAQDLPHELRDAGRTHRPGTRCRLAAATDSRCNGVHRE